MPKKSFSEFKDAIFGIFEHTKTFIGKMFYKFYVTFMKNAFPTISQFFIRQNAHGVIKVNCKIFKYWIEKKTFFSM